MNVLVTGGTGTLGRDVVMLLRQSGHRARILSRQPRGHVDAVQGDLKTGAGLTKALAGMEAIVHAASATRGPLAGRATDVRGTRRLLELARAWEERRTGSPVRLAWKRQGATNTAYWTVTGIPLPAPR